MSQPRPPWRDHDKSPKREDDLRLKAFGVEVEGSGRTVTVLIVAIVLALICGGLTIAGYWLTKDQVEKHDVRSQSEHLTLVSSIDRMVNVVETMTCVLTLNDAERVVFRETGKYCYSYNQLNKPDRETRRHERP